MAQPSPAAVQLGNKILNAGGQLISEGKSALKDVVAPAVKQQITRWTIRVVLKLIVIIIIIYLIISAWDAWLDAVIKKYFNLDKSLSGKFMLAVIATLIGIMIFCLFKIHPLHAIGLSPAPHFGE